MRPLPRASSTSDCVYDGATGKRLKGRLGDFQAFAAGEGDGVFVAGGDLDGDGRAEVIVGSDGGRGAVRAFSGRDGARLYEWQLTDDGALGARGAAGDVNGDGRADVVAAAGPGGAPRVAVFDGGNGAEVYHFFGADLGHKGGLFVAAGDVTGDGHADVVTGAADGGANLRLYSGADLRHVANWRAFEGAATGAPRVAVADSDGDGTPDVLAADGAGGGRLRRFDGAALLDAPAGRAPLGEGWDGGLFVGAAGPAGGGAGGGAMLLSTLPVVTVQAVREAKEGGPDPGMFQFTRTGDTSGTLDVGYYLSGTAWLSQDYTVPGSTNSVTFGVGESVAVKYVSVIDDALVEGPETVTVELFSNSYYTVGTPGAATLPIQDNDGPVAIPEDCGCSCDTLPEAVGVAAGAGANPVDPFGPGGVRAFDGAVRLGGTDLFSGAMGPWGVNRSWSNYPGPNSTGLFGNGMFAAELPFLSIDVANVITAVANGVTARQFDPQPIYYGGGYKARHYLGEKLVWDGNAGRYTLTDTAGARFVFFGFSGTPQRANLEKYIDPAGHETVVSWSGGLPSEVTRSSAVGTTTVDESLLFTTASNRVTAVTLRRRTNGGSWGAVRTAEYAYHDGTTNNGSAGDLKAVTLKDAAGAAVDREYYRWHKPTEANGFTAGLKYKLGPASYGRAEAALGAPDSLSDAQLAPYADLYLQYDGAGRVAGLTAQGEGCSSCSGGLGTYTYSYTVNGTATGYNNWYARQTTTLPDGSTRVVFANFAGQVMLDVVQSGGGEWATYHRYDSQGRHVLAAAPSAVSGYDVARPDLLDNQYGNYQYLRDSAGLIAETAYAASTTATSGTPGDVKGYLKATSIRRGELGTSVPQSAAQYQPRAAAWATVYFVANETVYRNANGTGAQTTSYAYSWHGSTLAPSLLTVTLPTVTTGQNGPGTADAGSAALDTYGRVTWVKDGADFLHYAEYDQLSGGVVKAITDVDSTQTGDFTGLPSGWSTPSGGGLHLKATAEVDGLGRATRETDPANKASYTVYKDAAHEVRVYAGWDGTTGLPTGPTLLLREDRAGGYAEVLTMTATPATSGGRPTGAEAVGGLLSLARSYTNVAGQVTEVDRYFDLAGLTYTTATTLGTENTHYHRTRLGYDWRGRNARVVSPTGTIYREVFDPLGRSVSRWVGTDDTGATHTDPTGGGASGNDMVKVSESQYDGGGVGDGNLTQFTSYPGLGATARVEQYFHDWRNRLVATKSGVEGSEGTAVNRPISYLEYDNLGQVIVTEGYDGDGVSVVDANGDGVPDRPSASLLRAKGVVSYDEQGRAYRTQVYSVNPSTGAVSSSALTTDVWYDRRGLVVKARAPGGLVTKTAHDGAGRETVSYATDGGGDTGWSDALSVTGDAVLEQVELTYDAAGNVTQTTARQRFHDEAGTGALGTPTSGVKARVSYAGAWYDLGDRLTATADVGTNGGGAWSRPGSAPSRSDTVLVTSQTYDSAGRVEAVTGPRGIVTRSYHDALGRVVKTIEAYADGAPSATDDKTVEYAYNGNDDLKSLTLRLPGGAYQTTEWVYGVTTAGGHGINSHDVASAVKRPDKTTGAASSSEQETWKVNALGEAVSSTDRNGTVHGYTRDVLGRLTADAVTTLGSGVDGAIRRLETAYDTQGNAYLFTSYDAQSAGNVVNQVQREYNGLGQLVAEYQSVSGAVNTGTTPKVQYAYTEMSGGANHSRLTSVVYPNGKVLTYNYASGLDSNISRLSSLSDASGTLESYDYLGLATVVRRARPQPGVDLTYVKQSGEGNGDAGDQYTGLDRFGRVVDQRWRKASDGSHAERLKYGYDRDGNRLYRENVVNSLFSELYHADGASQGYDALNQLAEFRRGALSDTNSDGVPDTVATASRSQVFSPDAAGNFSSVNTDGSGQTRSHNRQNQVTAVSGATAPAYDANGNLTTDEQGRTLKYDAWDRLVEVKQGTTTLAAYQHDALGRRVKESATRALYYSAGWQVIEERESGVAVAQSVFSPVYVDALVLRDRDTDANGSLDERLWVVQDANWNVTALLNGSGNVVERYVYDPFGNVSVLAGDWTVRGASLYAWLSLWQGLRRDAATGLYHARMRDYSATLMRWLQNDPIGFAGGDVNLYRAMAGDPVGWTDPSGLRKLDFWGAINPPDRSTGPGMTTNMLQAIRPIPGRGGDLIGQTERMLAMRSHMAARGRPAPPMMAGGLPAYGNGNQTAFHAMADGGRMIVKMNGQVLSTVAMAPLPGAGLAAAGGVAANLVVGDYGGAAMGLGGPVALRGLGAAYRGTRATAAYAGRAYRNLKTPGDCGLGQRFRSGFRDICFAAGTPLLTPGGSTPIERLAVGDLVLSRDETDPEGAVEARAVEEVFVRSGPVVELAVGGRVIRTTAEHPFWAANRRAWVRAAGLAPGDVLLGADGRLAAVEGVRETGDWETVYNLRVSDFHTYFVGSQEWGFSVWAHNTYDAITRREIVRDALRNAQLRIVRPSPRNPQHHVYPQESRSWFQARGINIDRYVVNLRQAEHQAIHGGGDWGLGREWVGEWNRQIMRRLQTAEAAKGSQLTPRQIFIIGRRMMREYGIDLRYHQYVGGWR